MATTTNFGWETPDDTDLVKDGAAAMRTLGNAIDTSLVDLKGGTTGQVLSKASNTDMDFTWVAQDDSNAIQNTIVDAKGDLISATAADTPARLAVGTNGQVLTADSTTATGLKWETASSGFSAYTSYTPTVTASTGTFTTVSGAGLYSQSGKVVVYNWKVNITNKGTAANELRVTLPIAAKTGSNAVGAALETAVTGTGGQALIYPSVSTTYLGTRTYNFGSWIVDGYEINGTIIYEVA